MKNVYAFILTNDCLIINKLRLFTINTKIIPLVDIFSVEIIYNKGNAEIQMTYFKNKKRKKKTIYNHSHISTIELADLIKKRKYI